MCTTYLLSSRHTHMSYTFNKNPYLLHRLRLENKDAGSLSSAFDFDYMGSAEFEIGTLWKVLETLHDADWVTGTVTLPGKHRPVLVRFLYPAARYDRAGVEAILRALWENKVRLKEGSRFGPEYRDRNDVRANDTWVDIESGLFFTWSNLPMTRLLEIVDGSIEIRLGLKEPVQDVPPPPAEPTAADLAGMSLRERMIASGQLKVRQ